MFFPLNGKSNRYIANRRERAPKPFLIFLRSRRGGTKSFGKDQITHEADSVLYYHLHFDTKRVYMNSVGVDDKATETLEAKEQKLRELIRSFGSVIVAFSVGVDSAYLAYVANSELRYNALAVTGDSAS